MRNVRTLSLEQSAVLLSISPRSLADKRYRAHLRLAARKVGRRLCFLESDLLDLLERGREHLPGERRQ